MSKKSKLNLIVFLPILPLLFLYGALNNINSAWNYFFTGVFLAFNIVYILLLQHDLVD